MNYGHSGQFANLGPSERRKGQWTRCAEVLRLCWVGGYKVKEIAERLGVTSSNVSLCMTKLRRRGLLVDKCASKQLTDAGVAECERLWPRRETG